MTQQDPRLDGSGNLTATPLNHCAAGKGSCPGAATQLIPAPSVGRKTAEALARIWRKVFEESPGSKGHRNGRRFKTSVTTVNLGRAPSRDWVERPENLRNSGTERMSGTMTLRL